MGGGAIDEDWEFRTNLRTIVLVGRTGNGKSATGNSILRKKAFKSMSSSAGVTSVCELQRTVTEDGHIINVIDTPGLFDFSPESESIEREILKCIDMSKDGIHAVLLVLSVRSRFSRVEEAVVHSMRTVFGEKITDYMVIIFTGGDDLEDNEETLDGYLGSNCPDPLKGVLEMCGNRCILFDNKTKDELKKSEQLNELLRLVDDVVDRNSGKPFTNELFVELKGEKELQDRTVELSKLEAYSREEVSQLMEQLQRSYTEQLNRMAEMLRETILKLEQKLEDEKRARLESEASAKADHDKSSEEIRKLREELDRATKEKQGKCIIL